MRGLTLEHLFQFSPVDAHSFFDRVRIERIGAFVASRRRTLRRRVDVDDWARFGRLRGRHCAAVLFTGPFGQEVVRDAFRSRVFSKGLYNETLI